MGTFMSSVAFRRADNVDWGSVQPIIHGMFWGVEGIVSNLETEENGYAIVSPYGDMGMFLAELPEKISALTQGYAVFSTCVDSDFCLIELYHKGKLLEKSCIGEMYMELDELQNVQSPNPELWKPLLLEQQNYDALTAALTGEEVFVEDQLREISTLTGFPIFDDKLVYGDEW